MEIEYIKGDATAPKGEGKKYIVHIVNDSGFWGKGFVLAISKKWLGPEEEYRKWAKNEDFSDSFFLGAIRFVGVTKEIVVVNLVGQRGINNDINGQPPIRYDAVEKGLRKLADYVALKGGSVHMPRIGTGLAGGKWEEIEPIINRTLIAAGITVTVYTLE